MLRQFLRNLKYKSVTPDLYNHIVAQSRQAIFFQDYGVVDDFEGRFSVLSIHMILVLDRLQSEGDEGEALSQTLVDYFFDDMDGVVRELGTGDMGVSHKIKKIANRFYGRMKSFQDCFESGGQEALEASVWRNIYPDRPEDGEADAQKMTSYMLSTKKDLESVPFKTFQKAGLIFP